MAGPVDRAGLTDVFVTGIVIRWISVRQNPIASGANCVGASLLVEPRITIRKKKVVTTSAMNAASAEYEPGEPGVASKPFAAKPVFIKAVDVIPALPIAIMYIRPAATIPPKTWAMMY